MFVTISSRSVAWRRQAKASKRHPSWCVHGTDSHPGVPTSTASSTPTPRPRSSAGTSRSNRLPHPLRLQGRRARRRERRGRRGREPAPAEAQDEALSIRGYDETHTGILESPAVAAHLNAILATLK